MSRGACCTLFMDTFTEITQKLWAPARRLYHEGIAYHSYLTELTWLLCLKIMPAYGILAHFNWDVFISQKGETQFNYYQKALLAFGQIDNPIVAGVFAHARTVFKHPEQLAQIIAVMEALPASEELGEIYEGLLEQATRQSGLSMAPRSLVDLMVMVTQPQPGELVLDPLAGTGSLLVAADQYMRVIREEVQLQGPEVMGIEPNLTKQRLALMNCWLHEIGGSLPVRWGDSLLMNEETCSPTDVIFSVLVGDPVEGLGKHDASLAWLQHIYRTLKPGGRAAVVVPDSVLNSPGPAQQIRRALLDNCVVHTVLRLPRGGALQVPTQALFFKRSQTAEERTREVWFYDARSSHRREYLREFERVYGEDPLGRSPRYEEGRWRCRKREELSNDSLDYAWLPEEAPERVWNLLDTTVAELEAVSELLG